MDSVQSRHPDESAGRLFTVTLADLYNYDPFPKGLAPDKTDHILGAEITAFSEYLTTPRAVQHVIFPRLDALSEVVWSPAAAHDWQGFLTRLQPQRLRYSREGINDADSAFAVDFTLQVPRSAVLAHREGPSPSPPRPVTARSITPPTGANRPPIRRSTSSRSA
jgi:hexosaminidase